jgi:hypothetical protein
MNTLISKIKNSRQITKKEKKIFYALYIVIFAVFLAVTIPQAIALARNYSILNHHQTMDDIANAITNDITSANEIKRAEGSELSLVVDRRSIEYKAVDGTLFKTIDNREAVPIFPTNSKDKTSINVSFEQGERAYMVTIAFTDANGKELVKREYAARPLGFG